jgi:hypothetical protein
MRLRSLPDTPVRSGYAAIAPPELRQRFLAAAKETAGEQQQVTVLFVDLVESTEIIGALDGFIRFAVEWLIYFVSLDWAVACSCSSRRALQRHRP